MNRELFNEAIKILMNRYDGWTCATDENRREYQLVLTNGKISEVTVGQLSISDPPVYYLTIGYKDGSSPIYDDERVQEKLHRLYIGIDGMYQAEESRKREEQPLIDLLEALGGEKKPKAAKKATRKK